MLKFLIPLLLSIALSWATKPMEPLTNYNVIMVHGAADNQNNGFKCEDVKAPYLLLKNYQDNTDNPWQIGNAPGMLGDYNNSDKLTYWLDTKIFENSGSLKDRIDSTHIYLQRSFTKPAGSPRDNGNEIGYAKWKCGERRSLIEEAQEIKAKGRDNLASLRGSVENRSLLPPSRNILIAHSMGGVASREYVQGDNYNNDVDKVITLDSPHKGTHSLDGLLDMKKWIKNPLKETAIQGFVAALGWGLTMVALNGGPPSDYQSLILIASGIGGMNATNATVDALVDIKLGYDYEDLDPLVSYIRPGSSDLNKLNSKPYSESLPMMRILGSEGGLTFGSNNEYAQNLVSRFVPDALYVPIKNTIAQISHTEVSDPAYFNNILASTFLGFIGGFSLTDHGSVLIPHWSGIAENVSALDNSNGNSKIYKFTANENTSLKGIQAFSIALAATTALGVASGLEMFNPAIVKVSRLSIAILAGTTLSSYMLPSTVAAIADMDSGHRMPILKEYQSKWFADKNTYSKILGGQESYEPYRMEEFLYEKPFVNLRVTSANDKLEKPLNSNLDSLGLLGANQTPLAAINREVTRKTKLEFKNSSDWERLGVKVDRWERVDGIDGKNSVPIRHADRYAMPDVSVAEFIENYRFIVDDLMPHRLRQIRINFNFREDVAWECDVGKEENAMDACSFYRRSSDGAGWAFKKKCPHPVKKDGTFDFKPREYGIELLNIQKDNQNTVNIATVNKIGLSNSQRFNYLFKATDDLIEQLWPAYGVRLTSAKDFKIHSSVLDYKGFSVKFGADQLLPSSENIDTNKYVPMVLDVVNGQDAIFTSKSLIDKLTEGSWEWHYKIKTGDDNRESIWENNIPFYIDTTPPNISLEANKELNPKTSTFMARFKNTFTDTTGDKSLRLVHIRLDKIENGVAKKSYELPLLTNVIASEFGISWDGLDTSKLDDGTYRIKALAFDGAVGNADQYELMNRVVAKDKPLSFLLTDSADLSSVQPGINSSVASVDFIIDKTAPKIESFALSVNIDSNKNKPSHSLDDSKVLTLNEDRLLRMNYTIKKSLYGRDSTLLRLSWEFLDKKDSTVMFHLGDNLYVKNNTESSFWEESAQMKISDGDYIIRMRAVDVAGNESFAYADKSLHVDRVAPIIWDIFTSSLVYPNVPSNGYKATIYVAQRDEIKANRSKFKCYYRISGPDYHDKEWIFFAEDSLTISSDDTLAINFPLNSNSVGATQGKRYLEGGCMDAAGNFASTVDLFHIGHLTPSIVYPNSSSFPDQPIVAIRGIAPAPAMTSGDGKAAYRLRWRTDNGEWTTEGIDVGAGKRQSDDTPWLSNEIQDTESDLGFWNRKNLPNDDYWLELSVRQCGTCSWVSDSVKVTLGNLAPAEAELAVVIDNPASITGGEEAELSVRIEGGTPDKDFRIRFYGIDADGRSLFETGTDRVKNSPFNGKPSISGNGIWLWEEAGKYHLQWNGLPNGDSLIVAYRQGNIADVCKNEVGQGLNNCSEISWPEIPKEAADISGIPAGLNRAMSLLGSSGHLMFSNKEAFYVNFGIGKSLPIHLGANKTEQEELANIARIVSVNPALYGLSMSWNGLTDTGLYPAAGTAHLHVDVFENVPGGIVLRSSRDMLIKQPALEIVSAEADTLSEFYVVKQESSGLELGSKTLSYGIRGRDAFVNAWIEDESGASVKNLHLPAEPQKAALSKSAYKLLWDGTNEDGHVVDKAGIYKFVISAKEYNGDNTVALSRPFKLTLAGMQVAPGEITDIYGSAIMVAEAVADSNNPERQYYAPTVDYLVKADLSGYTLPDSLRTVNISYELGGTQVAQGYKPKRFSLALKRQRDSLDLVILYRVTARQWEPEYPPKCGWKNEKEIPHYGVMKKSFTNGNSRTEKIIIEYDRNSGYGFIGGASLDVWVVLPKDYELKKFSYNENGAEDAIKSIEDKKFEFVWNKTDIYISSENSSGIPPYSNQKDTGCIAEDKVDGKICNEKTDGYDPNANLFVLTASPKNNNFFTNYENIASTISTPFGEIGCNNPAFKKININLKLEIPKEYWDAGFGYDNLVNRTIRLDHTNVTIFGNNGYLATAKEHIGNSYYDGSSWRTGNTNYGLLTPFEIHKFPFVSAQDLSDGKNIFLFPDEGKDHKYPSKFHAKFYNIDTLQGRFRADIQGTCSGNSCKSTLYQNENQDTIITKLMDHGSASVYVTLEANSEDFPNDSVHIPYPASTNWINNINADKKCPSYTDGSWGNESKGLENCLKFYRAGSKVHYYYNDYDSSAWEKKMLMNATNDRKIFKNQFNSSISMKADSPETMLGLNPNLMGSNKILETLTVTLNPEKYNEQSREFYLNSKDIAYPVSSVSGGTIKPIIAKLDQSKYRWNENGDSLLFPAEKWKSNIAYRYTNHKEASFPSIDNSELRLTLEDLYTHQSSIGDADSLYKYLGENEWKRNEWIKSVSMANQQITQLDGTEHKHFTANLQDSSVILERKSPFPNIRPAELVSIHGRVPGEGTQYQILYVVNNKDDKKEFHTLKTGRMGESRGTSSTPPLLSWFDVNRLQGNTSLFLSWGEGAGNLLYRKLDLYVGKRLNNFDKDGNLVTSLFGEVSVLFPKKVVADTVDITVRTVNPDDYAFTTFNNASLRGPIVEVLPSMQFDDPESYPRVKSRIHKNDLKNITPDRVRLYKVDFKNGQFVPLYNTQIGFLKADGRPAVDYSGEGETKMCEPSQISDCGLNTDWTYLLVSAQTSTFSVFVALDSMSLIQSPVSFAVLPELSTNRVREVKISGIENYRIYISNSSKWNGDSSAVVATLERGANGETLITLPERLNSWLYLVALNEDGEELSDSPISVYVQLIPSEISCHISTNPLWLGLDNGYLELPQECNQPAMGTLQLRQNGNPIAEARQSLPDTLRWNGKIGINKIAHGDYSSRYIAVGTTGQEMQIIGPAIYTDTLRPVISNFGVEESFTVLDREFKIHAKASDELSGIQSIRLNWTLGDVISSTVLLNPTNNGNINYTLYIPRKQLAQCVGCKLKISLRAEDKGHNWTEQEWQSSRMWPYPTELALWYPAQEGGGKTAREYIGTGHDLDLLMPNPWLSASGIYFDSTDKKAAGKGQVDLGRTNSYTLEAWVRPGYASATPSWHRILGLRLANGRHVDLQVKGSDVRLLDGIQAWAVPELLSQPKTWSHLAVAVDGDYARFYLDGKLAGTIAAVPSERVWFGSLSLGTDDNAPSFIGHLMQVRLYKKALAEEEVYALFSGAGLGDDGSRVEIVLAGELDWKIDGVGREFSCAVPGSSYWETSKESTLSWKAWVERTASYRIFLYARSAQPGNKIVKAGVSGALVSGTVSLENVWRSVALQEMALPLKAGFNDIELRFPAGMDIAGIALSDNSGLLPSQISWKSESSVVSPSTVDAQVRFEGQTDPSMLRPRIRLQNIGSSTIYGPKVRYYFRGEDPAQVQTSKFYPQEGTLAVRQEGYNLGYAEWSFPETTVLPSGQLLFWGEGPHFGLNNANYAPWVAKDDPGIVVLDVDNRLLSGSCFENEQPLNTTPVLQVMARDSRFGDNQASQLYIKLENIGQVPVRDYEVRYSFYVSGNAVPVLDVYDMQGLSASLNNLGSGRWQVVISGTASLGPGISWANPAQFALHLPNWQTGWNAGDDPSHEGITAEWMLAKGIEVFDASGNRIYGKEPVWPIEVDNQDNLIWGIGLMAPSEANNPSIGITRLPDGLLVTLLENSQLRLDLVNAAGMPQKFLYQGTLGVGEHIIPVNWSNIDFTKTYLVARLNGKITTQLISTLGN